MRFKIKVILLVGMLLCIAVLGWQYTLNQVPVPQGTWKDVSEDYYVVFRENGTYVESVFNIPRTFTYDTEHISYYDVTGELRSSVLFANYGAHMTLTLNGKTHVLKKVRDGENAKLSNWSEGFSGEPRAAYKVLNDFDGSNYVRLFSDSMYRSVWYGTEITGKYVQPRDGKVYLLAPDGSISGQLVEWDNGYVTGLLEGAVSCETVEGTSIGRKCLVLSGEVFDSSAGTHYEFVDDDTVIVTLCGTHEIEFVYAAGTDGLVTLSDIAGAGERDYLYVDTLTGEVYRYVLASDSWFDFLSR